MSRKFKNKPKVVDAFQRSVDFAPNWFAKYGFTATKLVSYDEYGEMDVIGVCNPLDYVIHYQGDVYPLKKEDFEQLFDEMKGAEALGKPAPGKYPCETCQLWPCSEVNQEGHHIHKVSQCDNWQGGA